MQTTSYGNDPDALDDFAGQLSSSADALDQVVQHTTAALLTTGWHGAAADRFRYDWNSRYTAMLRNAASQLREGAQTLRRNAAQQRTASTADDSGWTSVHHGAEDLGKGAAAARTLWEVGRHTVRDWDKVKDGIGHAAHTVRTTYNAVVTHDLDAVSQGFHDLKDERGSLAKFLRGGKEGLHTFQIGLHDVKGVLADTKQFLKETPGLDKLSIGFDVFDLGGGIYHGFTTGDWHDAIQATEHTVWDGVGLAVPEIGLAQAAIDLTKLTIDHGPEIADFARDHTAPLTINPTLPAGGAW